MKGSSPEESRESLGHVRTGTAEVIRQTADPERPSALSPPSSVFRLLPCAACYLMGRHLLILGPPGAGKGTQAALVCKALGIPHVSTGEMLRDHVARGTELGKQAKVIMDAGDLVSDEIVIAMVAERLAQADAACGFLLDGFPRTAPQAGALEDVIAENPLDGVIVLEVPEDEIVDRTLARGRSDDTAESVRTRLTRYHEQTAPLISFYEARSDMACVDGVGTIDEVLARIVGALAR